MRRVREGSFEPGIRIPADWLNHVQEEICFLIESVGIVLDPEQNDQLLQALRIIRDTFTAMPWYNVEDYGAFARPVPQREMFWSHGGNFQTVPRIYGPLGTEDDFLCQTAYFKAAFDAALGSLPGYGTVIAPPGFFDFRSKLVVGDPATKNVRKIIFRGYNSSFRVWDDDHAVEFTEVAAADPDWPVVMTRWERSFFVSANTVHPFKTIFKIAATLDAPDGPPTFRYVSGHFFDYENLYS